MHFCEKLQKHPELIELNYILSNYKKIKNSKDIDFKECFSYITNNKTRCKYVNIFSAFLSNVSALLCIFVYFHQFQSHREYSS